MGMAKKENFDFFLYVILYCSFLFLNNDLVLTL